MSCIIKVTIRTRKMHMLRSVIFFSLAMCAVDHCYRQDLQVARQITGFVIVHPK